MIFTNRPVTFDDYIENDFICQQTAELITTAITGVTGTITI